MRVEITDQTFRRLQALAEPLVDTTEDVMIKLLDFYAAQKEAEPLRSMQDEKTSIPSTSAALFTTRPRTREALHGFRKELWESVIVKLSPTFSLHDVYAHMAPLVELRPHVREMEAAIRHSLQRLRDMGYVEFLDRGEYRRIA
ncbi:MAG: hypothetical protein ACRDGA_02820 [Bacteroidota bacterium]